MDQYAVAQEARLEERRETHRDGHGEHDDDHDEVDDGRDAPHGLHHEFHLLARTHEEARSVRESRSSESIRNTLICITNAPAERDDVAERVSDAELGAIVVACDQRERRLQSMPSGRVSSPTGYALESPTDVLRS